MSPTDDIGAPEVEFFLIDPDAPAPAPASSSVRGSLPSRAVQFCPPIMTASSFGWYVFPPLDFALRWDGRHTEWALIEDNEPSTWYSLAGGHDVARPDGARVLEKVPAARRGDLAFIFGESGEEVGFLNADPRAQNTIEVHAGLIMRTSPGWVTLTRSVPNWPHSPDYQLLEGVIETEWYRSLIPTMVRLTTPGRVVRFYRSEPMMVVQVVPKAAATASASWREEPVAGLDAFPEEVWKEFVGTRSRRQAAPKPGGYLREVKRRERRFPAEPPRD